MHAYINPLDIDRSENIILKSRLFNSLEISSLKIVFISYTVEHVKQFRDTFSFYILNDRTR